MKKKILSLILSVFVAVGCLFTFSGCSLVKENDETSEQIVLTVGDSDFNKSDVLASFYSFLYRNYALIYNGTSSSVIEEKFYNSLIKDKIVMEKAQDALENGTIKYLEKDAEDVWQGVEDYFRSQIDSYEKDLYESEEDYPIWLEGNNEKEDKFFESYEDPSIKNNIDKGAEVERLNRDDMLKKDAQEKTKLDLIYAAMFNYVADSTIDDDGIEHREYEEIKDADGVDASKRRQAFALYMENIFLNAKAEGKYESQDSLMLDQVMEIYDSYYEAKIAELFQRYCEEVLLFESGELSPENEKDSVVKLFLQAMSADKQNYLNETNYVSVITGDDTKLVLYHNNDKYFTVQHILLKFDDELVNLIKQDPFYVDMASSDVQYEIYEQFMENREQIITDYFGTFDGALTDINEDQVEKMPSFIIDDRYYDYYTYSALEGYQLSNESIEGAKKMATADNIINCYNANVDHILNCVRSVLVGSATIDEFEDDIQYIFEASQKIFNSYDATNKTLYEVYNEAEMKIREKVSSLVFNALTWVFSDDGLDNTYYKQLGYVISRYPDDNNGFTHEFVDTSKDIFDKIKDGEIADINSVSKTHSIATTKDGIHIIKIENIFEAEKSLIDIAGIDKTDVDAVAKLMQETFICNGSDKTVYDYYRDLIYSDLAGDESTNGSFFENLKNAWLQEYMKDNKISYDNKLSYDEIMAELYSY